MIPNVLFIGNPGVGKSYLLNMLGGNFASGFSAGSGLTVEYSFCESYIGGSKVRLIDAPGLLETSGERTLRSAKKITSALSMQGGYKLLFVLGNCAGRVLPSDLYMINKVMAAIDFSIDVGVIFNTVPDDQVKLYHDATSLATIIQQLNSVANNRIKSEWARAIPRTDKNDLKDIPSKLFELLQSMVFQNIPHVRSVAATVLEHDQFAKHMNKNREDGVEWLAKRSQKQRVEGSKSGSTAVKPEVAKSHKQALVREQDGNTTTATVGNAAVLQKYHDEKFYDPSPAHSQEEPHVLVHVRYEELNVVLL